nr:hypothetical protein [Mycoplasmopsis bovis]
MKMIDIIMSDFAQEIKLQNNTLKESESCKNTILSSIMLRVIYKNIAKNQATLFY